MLTEKEKQILAFSNGVDKNGDVEKGNKLGESEKNGHLNPVFKDENGRPISGEKEEEEDDPWKVSNVIVDQVPLSELDCFGKVKRIFLQITKVILVFTCLYFFICSLDFLSSAFKLLGGKSAGEVFRNSEILSNPVAGLMMGVLVTVLVQSSSTSTSIIISMVGAQILDIRTAIPIVMGANIGTSVTNTIVALGQISDKSQFRRAFAGATVHDMFNWMSVIILLPLEMITGYLYRLSGAIIRSLPLEQNKAAKKDLLKVITKPFTELIIMVDSKAINKIALSKAESHEISLMKTCCDKVKPEACCDGVLEDQSWYNESSHETYSQSLKESFCTSMGNTCIKDNSTFHVSCANSWTTALNSTNEAFSCSNWTAVQDLTCYKPCNYLFKGLIHEISEEAIGAILLVVALAILCLCLVFIVKLLSLLLKGQMALIIKKFINADFPGAAAYFTGYIAILLGAGLTILVQSSSIFTSSITPLVGMGVIELDRMYPLTLGANIGTTTTGILSALAQDSDTLAASLQVAFCHLFFNISGILLFYPIPFTRIPIPMSKFLGNETAKYRWFALVYILAMFFLFPAAVFALSIPGWYVLAAVLIPIAIVAIAIVVIKVIQRKRPLWLPIILRDWKFLPKPCRSLEPIDSCMTKIFRCKCCVGDQEVVASKTNGIQNGHTVTSNGGTPNQDTHM